MNSLQFLNAIILLFCLISSVLGCKEVQDVPSSQVIELTKFAEFEDHIGEKVTLIGRYNYLNLSQRPGGEPIYNGRIQIVLRDSRAVLLETHDLGLRSDEEIKKFEGKKVAVTGVIGKDCLAWGFGEVASIVAPCICKIERLEFAR